MNILDENIPESQRQLLRSWKFKSRQIGHEIGRPGMNDEEVVTLLHKFRHMTFFTRDLGFYKRHLCHQNYCLVILDVNQYEAASFIKRFLQHQKFNTKRRRMGKVVRITHIGIQTVQMHDEKEEISSWKI